MPDFIALAVALSLALARSLALSLAVALALARASVIVCVGGDGDGLPAAILARTRSPLRVRSSAFDVMAWQRQTFIDVVIDSIIALILVAIVCHLL